MAINVRIKSVGEDADGNPRPVTSKVFLREKRFYAPLVPGEIVELPEDEAKAFLRRVDALEITLEDANREPPPAPSPFAPPRRARASMPTTRMAKIEAVVRGLSGKDSSNWTDAGVPRVEAIEKRVGFDITAAERDAAWATVQGEPSG